MFTKMTKAEYIDSVLKQMPELMAGHAFCIYHLRNLLRVIQGRKGPSGEDTFSYRDTEWDRGSSFDRWYDICEDIKGLLKSVEKMGRTIVSYKQGLEISTFLKGSKE